MNVCKLCNKYKKLIDAHIVPKWAFKKIRGMSHTLLSVSMGRNKRRPIGFYDSGILCAACDNALGIYDSYGKEVLYNKEKEGHGDMILIKNVDSDKFKLFILSVFWRASISSIQEMDDINLGPWEDIIKNKILNPKTKDELFFYITQIGDGSRLSELFKRGIMNPVSYKTEKESLNMSCFYLPDGYRITLKIDKRKMEAEQIFKSVAQEMKNIIWVIKDDNFKDSNELKTILDIANKKNR